MAERPVPNMSLRYMKIVAIIAPQTSGKKAQQSHVDKLSNLVTLLGEDPKKDYGASKVEMTPEALNHLNRVGAAIEAIASLLVEISDQKDSPGAIAATGFTQYFAQYYCQSHGVKVKFPNNDNLADLCNSNVIAPTLHAMLKNVKK